MNAITVKIKDVRPGDVLVNCVGQDFFRVSSVHPARARGYVVFNGQSLRPGGGQTEGGYGQNTVTVRRIVHGGEDSAFGPYGEKPCPRCSSKELPRPECGTGKLVCPFCGYEPEEAK